MTSSVLIDEETAEKAVRLIKDYHSWLKIAKSPYVLGLSCNGSDVGTGVVIGYEGTERISHLIKIEAENIAKNLAYTLKQMGFKP